MDATYHTKDMMRTVGLGSCILHLERSVCMRASVCLSVFVVREIKPKALDILGKHLPLSHMPAQDIVCMHGWVMRGWVAYVSGLYTHMDMPIHEHKYGGQRISGPAHRCQPLSRWAGIQPSPASSHLCPNRQPQDHECVCLAISSFHVGTGNSCRRNWDSLLS